MKTEPFTGEAIPEIVAFWNASFLSQRLFVPLTEELFRARVVERSAFRPEGMRIARIAGDIVGIGHASRKADQGFLSLLYVAPRSRSQGIGSRLLDEVMEWLGPVPRVRAGAVIFDPVYGVHFDDRRAWGGPRMPFWGSSEGLAARAADLETRNFMLKRGFAPEDPDYSMLVSGLRGRDESSLNRREQFAVARRKYEIRVAQNSSSRHGSYRFELPHRCVQLYGGGRPLGECMWFAFDGNLALIYDFYLETEARGKGLGRAVLLRALADIKDAGLDRCDLTTGSRRNARAVKVYRMAGFRVDEVWQPYSRGER
ncbi:MAG: GNAT family N-acetyltransferase [Armatimonadota bacterium]|nr:MAG: GNAT family N-acetyltransferase [Armatimonadota bacterium]